MSAEYAGAAAGGATVSAEVEVLKREPVAEGVNPDIITILETALKDARAGSTVGIVLVECDKDSASYSTAGVDNRWELVGHLMRMVNRLLGQNAG